MNFTVSRETEKVWQLFEKICSIPHPSGSEQALAAWITRLAEQHHLSVKQDAVGNLRIDRPAAKGFEHAPVIILQAHLDMVPQVEAGETFHFLTDSIELKEENGWVRAAKRTTLGSDDGIGVAAALAVLLDEELRCGPLAAVFTVEEETGLTGAGALSGEFLAGDFLFNLDSEEEGIFYVGCAGGARMEAVFTPETELPKETENGVEIVLGGLAGGHSGTNINDRRGNAIVFLCRFLAEHPEFRISSVRGGSLDNVIPREAAVTGCIADAGALYAAAEKFRDGLKQEFDAPDSFDISVRPAQQPFTVWQGDFQQKVLNAITNLPNGVIAMDRDFDVVRTSSNLAAWESCPDGLRLRTSQRSLCNGEREELTMEMIRQCEAAGGRCSVSSIYSGWTPSADSVLNAVSREVYSGLFGTVPEFKVIHAGLECGILQAASPGLEMISFGPTLTDPHSPAEKLEIASVERFYRFLQSLVVKFAKKSKDL